MRYSYVELLEQQQAQLVAGIRAMWSSLPTEHGWKTTALPNEGNGKVFVHDILDRIGALKAACDYDPDQSFLEDPEQMQHSLASRPQYQYRLPSPFHDSPDQSPGVSTRPTPQQVATTKAPLDKLAPHSCSPVQPSSPSTADSSALHTPTSPDMDLCAYEMAWLSSSTPCLSQDDNWGSGPFFCDTALPDAPKSYSPLKPHAFLTGEMNALLAGYDPSQF